MEVLGDTNIITWLPDILSRKKQKQKTKSNETGPEKT